MSAGSDCRHFRAQLDARMSAGRMWPTSLLNRIWGLQMRVAGGVERGASIWQGGVGAQFGSDSFGRATKTLPNLLHLLPIRPLEAAQQAEASR